MTRLRPASRRAPVVREHKDGGELRVLFAGGGSGGHLAPSVAVWRAVQRRRPDARAHFVCSVREEDAAFLRKEELPFDQIPLPRLSLAFPLRFWRAYRRAAAILRQYRPSVVFSKGGSVSAPAVLAAKRFGIPIVLHESDAVSGRANRLVARWATVVCRGFPTREESRSSRSNRRASRLSERQDSVFTGNPVRPELLHGSREKGLRLAGLPGTRPILLVMGGSQGAQALNRIIVDKLDDLLAFCDVIHLTGRGKETDTQRSGYFARAFAHADLAHLYAAADACISRAGAGSIAELSLLGIPSLLVPLRGVAQDHQAANAAIAAAMGGFRSAEQSTLPHQLIPLARELLLDTRARSAMQASLRAFAVPDAADHLAKILIDLVGFPA